MKKVAVILIFDIGKTNKKLLLFDEHYKVVYEQSVQLEETTDEDGFACEDVNALTQWVKDSFDAVLKDDRFNIKAVNISAYGASFVYLDKDGHVMLPLYNYLKPYSPKLKQQFYTTYGGESSLGKQTASPALGNLNSGMQLYRLKYEKPALYKKIAVALHLPQYISYLLSDKQASDITSIGCHTQLWDFQNHNYHHWATAEGIEKKLATILPSSTVIPFLHSNKNYISGIGLHDSSAALIPYLTSFKEPFILLSTGTWCISLNPFNHTRISDYELHNDCLCYISYEGKPVKASRLFAGYEHEQQVKKLAAHFNKPLDYYTTIACNKAFLKNPIAENIKSQGKNSNAMVGQSAFGERLLTEFANYEEAYHQLIADIIVQQVRSTNLVLKGTLVKRIFVDGGFGRNPIYMYLLSKAFPGIKVYAASVPQASALGAALVIHQHWNSKPLPLDLIELKYYAHQEIAKH